MNFFGDINRNAAPIKRLRKSWPCNRGQILAMALFGNFLWPASHAVFGAAAYESSGIVPPKPIREFRGAWIATIANLDWPSRKGLSTVEQKAELLGLFDRAVQLKLNTIIFQVRPACDAFYASSLEPWSEYLTGTMGKAPLPFYDPLAFAIEEAHKRGLELHAWFNPYRARNSFSKSALAANHISKAHPQLVRQYGNQLWLDPGEKEVQKHSLAVVLEVVRRYDIDGVHFDDYFYPYPEKDHAGNYLEFPDLVSWKRYGAGGGLSRDDWRRENVNGFIREVYESIRAAKPWVKFGISPFGIWRPAVPLGIDPHAIDAYGKLYADSRKWLMNGWVDYFAPQLYWAIEPKEHSFSTLLKWWAEQNPKERHLLAGLDATKTENNWSVQEIVNQIRVTRQQNGVSGHIHWDMKALKRNSSLAAGLEHGVYLQPALVPASPWLGSTRPDKPRLSVEREAWNVEKRELPSAESVFPFKVSWEAIGAEKAWLWVLQARKGGEWTTEILPGRQMSRVGTRPPPEVIALTAIDRNGNTGVPAVMQVKTR